MDPSAVRNQIQELTALRKQKRIWQLGTSALLILIAIVCLAKLRGAVTDLVQEGPAQKAFVDDLGTSMQTHVIPAVQELGSQALREIDLNAEVKKLNQYTPELAQVSLQQINLLSENLPKRGEKVWKSTFEAALKSREAKIKAMYPDITEDQLHNVLANLVEEAQIQVVAINDALISKHQKALKDIVAGVDHIRDTEPKGQQEPATWEMALMVFDIAREDLRALEPKQEKAAKPAAKGGKK
jgi:hypothetical protein